MKKIKKHNKANKQLEKFLKLIVKLPHEQYFGVARILNVSFTETMSKEEIIEEIKSIEENLKEIEEKNSDAREVMKNSDETVVEDNIDSTIESEKDNSNRIEGMKSRLEKLKEEEKKDAEDIKIQKFRTGEDIMLDTIEKFKQLSSTKKKNLLSILKAGAY